MAVRYFCDRCDVIATQASLRNIKVQRKYAVDEDSPLEYDLCGDCYRKVKEFLDEQPGCLSSSVEPVDPVSATTESTTFTPDAATAVASLTDDDIPF